jgi:hypothetical protein
MLACCTRQRELYRNENLNANDCASINQIECLTFPLEIEWTRFLYVYPTQQLECTLQVLGRHPARKAESRGSRKELGHRVDQAGPVVLGRAGTTTIRSLKSKVSPSKLKGAMPLLDVFHSSVTTERPERNSVTIAYVF